MPMTKSTLKTALPTMVPKPTADRLNVPTNDVASSGADPPAAMSVAPATSLVSPSTSVITSRLGTKYSSQTMARPRNMYSVIASSNKTATPFKLSPLNMQSS